jgi:DNA-binding protein YbaB
VTTPWRDERMDELQHAIAEYPSRITEISERIAAAASQTVTAVGGNGQVVVAVTGDGQVRSVRVTHRALRELDDHTLAEQVKAAVNEGLDRADALVADARGGHEASAAAEEAVARYERRMDEMLYELDVIDRRLDRLDD